MPGRGAGAALTLALAGLLALAGCTEDFRLSGGTRGLAPVGSPADAEAPDGLIVGHRLMAAGEYELALNAYSRAASDRGLTVDVLSALGSANLKLGRLGQAEALLEQAVEEDGTFAPAWNNLGVVLTGKKEYVAARQAFEAAFANDNGQSEEIWQNLLLAIENQENAQEDRAPEAAFQLVRRGNGRFLLLETPK